MAFYTLMAIIAGVLLLGGGFGYLFYLFTRPKKMAWEARIWQLADGVQKKGNWTLKDLRPYTKDILERIEPEPGNVIHRLQNLGKTCPKPTSGTIEKWGQKPEVNVLYHESGCTLLTKGYDAETGNMIFSPLSHETASMIMSEMATKKSKLDKEKTTLEAITPWVVTGIMAVTLIVATYIVTQGLLKIADQNAAITKYASDKNVEVAETFREALLGYREMANNTQRLASPSGVPGIT